MLAVGAGLRGAREVMSLARAGAKDLGAVMEGSRIVRGLREAGTAVKDVLSIVGSKAKGWASDLIKGEDMTLGRGVADCQGEFCISRLGMQQADNMGIDATHLPSLGTPLKIVPTSEMEDLVRLKDAANASMHDPFLSRLHIHERIPVKFGGSPVDALNKILMLGTTTSRS